MTKYIKSAEALPSNLHLWETVHTQTGIVETKTIDVFPTTSIEASDTLTFIIPAMSKLMLQNVQIVSEIRVLTATGTNPAADQPVGTAPHLAAALYRNVEIYAGSTSLVQSFDNAYAMTKFWETTLNTRSGAHPHLHSKEGYYIDRVHSKAHSEDVDYFPADGNTMNFGGKYRAENIAEGKKVCLVSDLDASLFKQDKLLPSELEMQVSLTKNYSEFILLSADNQTNKVVFDKVTLRCTFQRPQDSILGCDEIDSSNLKGIRTSVHLWIIREDDCHEELRNHTCDSVNCAEDDGRGRSCPSEPSCRLTKRRRESCTICGATIAIFTPSAMANHQASQSCKLIECSVCHVSYPLLNHIEHGAEHYRQSRHVGPAWELSNDFSVPDFIMEQDFREIYTSYEKYIKPSRLVRTLSAMYNYQLHRLCIAEIKEHLLAVFRDQKTAFKLKISLGFILRNNEDQSLHYYYASQNNQLLFSDPHFVGNLEDLSKLARRIDELDLLSHVTYPNSKFSFVRITNVSYFLTKVLKCPIGAANDFPAYLKNNRGLNSLVSYRGKPYKDQLCFFRCLALFMGANIDALERKTKELFERYLSETKIMALEFSGVSLNELEEASRIFDIGICVFSQNENGATENVFRTLKEDNVMHIHLHKEHFSYIKNLKLFSHSFRCGKCNKLFPTLFRQRRHSATCEAATRDIYVGGAFEPNRTIFDKLEDFGIVIPSDLRFYPYRACFDIECALVRDTGVDNSARVEFSAKHLLASVSVCSNVPGHEQPTCLISTGCEKELVKRFIEVVTEISDISSGLMRERFSEYMEAVHQIDDEKLVDRFEEYLQQLPLLSFCGQKYDIPTMRTQLFSVLLQVEEINYVIKRGSSYSAISTENFLFLDVTNYLAAGSSYDQFLKGYGATVHKSFFPYEYFNDLGKLASTQFPRYQDFFSSLKGRNTLEPTADETLSVEEQLVVHQNGHLTVDQVLTVGVHRYESLRRMFVDNNWTFGDFLAYYNNRDVEPFLEAVENMVGYYEERGVDIFKEAISVLQEFLFIDSISVPGISLRLAFKGVKDNFHLFSKRHSDLVKLFLAQNVGGPALIFDRYQEVGVTKIGHDIDAPFTKKILGLDANALYLWCTAQDMATGIYIRRRADDNFKKEYPSPISFAATEWLADVEHRENIRIDHARNVGEYRVGPRRRAVDGFCRASNTIYQFHGCW
ncbi:hypothetical protein ACHWQZ_G008128 [Mnemiopsis leidyi]